MAEDDFPTSVNRTWICILRRYFFLTESDLGFDNTACDCVSIFSHFSNSSTTEKKTLKFEFCFSYIYCWMRIFCKDGERQIYLRVNPYVYDCDSTRSFRDVVFIIRISSL